MNRRRALFYLAATFVVALVAWRLTAEIVEPHALLWLQPPSAVLEAPGPGGTTVRLYNDTRPYVGKIAGLQKGLVWIKERRGLVEEGYGFGCPIVEVQGRAHVSRQARIEALPLPGGTRLTKHFDMDTVDTPIRFLKRKYQPTPSLGTVTVQYDVYPQGEIEVEVDFSGLQADWTGAYLMNEQGARHFVRYRDDSGEDIQAREIGIWQQVKDTVQRACLSRESGDLEFCVEPEEKPTVYYGRERYWQRNWRGLYYLSWSGIDIEIDAPRETYRYRIALEAR